jgi:predicted transcriptional regulator
MEKEVVDFIARCIECQKVKAEHKHLDGLLQPLPILEWMWEVVIMDFISKFLRTAIKQHDSIMVVVDKLTKVAHFIPMKSAHKEEIDRYIRDIHVINC